MQTKLGRKPTYEERMELFIMRLPVKHIKQLQKLAVKNGYVNKASGGVSGYTRDLLLERLKTP